MWISLGALVACLAFAGLSTAVSRVLPTTRPSWTGSWSSSPVRPGPLLSGAVAFFSSTGGHTVRDVVHTTLGGSEIRVRLSNVFGSRPATFEDVRVAISSRGAGISAGTSRRLRFGGHTSVTVQIGAQITSDPVKLTIQGSQNLAISLYSSQPTGTVTTEGSLNHTNYISGAGDVAGGQSGASYPTTSRAWYWLGGVDVLPARPTAGAIVALGDSITAGFNSTLDANRDWVDLLANRLRNHASARSVLNAGISGNNLHEDSPCYGQSGIKRLTRDALDQTGVRYVILDLGVNDITHPHEPPSAPLYGCLTHHAISAQGMITLFKLAIRRIHARHLKVIGVTLSPFGRYVYWSAAIEAERQAINNWIRTTHAFDGVIDFDKVLRGPGHPSWLNPAYDSGDHLHPNDAGHAAMAQAVKLSLFR